LNAAENPARAGEVVLLFATGGGAITPPGQDGGLVGDTLPKPVAPVTVQIGGKDAVVQYAGGAPGLTNGLLQVNVVVPAGLASGAGAVGLEGGGGLGAGGVTGAGEGKTAGGSRSLRV